MARDAKCATFAVLTKEGAADVQTIMAVGPVPTGLLVQMTKSLSAPLQAHRLS